MEKKPRTIRSKNRNDFAEFAVVYKGQCRFCGDDFYYQQINTKDCDIKCHSQYNGWHWIHPREKEIKKFGIPLKREWQLEAGYKLTKYLRYPECCSPDSLLDDFDIVRLRSALSSLNNHALCRAGYKNPELPISILIDPETMSPELRIRIRNERNQILLNTQKLRERAR